MYLDTNKLNELSDERGFVDTPNHDLLMNRKEAARYIGFKPNTLAVWDCTKRYDLKPVKIGRSVRYRKSVLDKFLDSAMQPE